MPCISRLAVTLLCAALSVQCFPSSNQAASSNLARRVAVTTTANPPFDRAIGGRGDKVYPVNPTLLENLNAGIRKFHTLVKEQSTLYSAKCVAAEASTTWTQLSFCALDFRVKGSGSDSWLSYTTDDGDGWQAWGDDLSESDWPADNFFLPQKSLDWKKVNNTKGEIPALMQRLGKCKDCTHEQMVGPFMEVGYEWRKNLGASGFIRSLYGAVDISLEHDIVKSRDPTSKQAANAHS